MTARRTFAARVERGETVARGVLVIAFRVVVFVLFAPIAWHGFASGDMLAGFLGLAAGVGLGAMLAPSE